MFPTKNAFVEATKDSIDKIKLKDHECDWSKHADDVALRLNNLHMVDESHTRATSVILQQAMTHPSATLKRKARDMNNEILTGGDAADLRCIKGKSKTSSG